MANRTAIGEIIKVLGQRDQRKNVSQNVKPEKGGNNTWVDLAHHHTTHETGGDDALAVSDTMIGSRTIVDSTAANTDTGFLTTIVSMLAYMIKAITGKSTWRTAPATTLEVANTHIINEPIHVHIRVRLASTAAVTLNGTQTVDGIATVDGNRILIKDQADKKTNGIYVASSSGAWSRATDFDSAADIVSGAAIYVMSGSTLAKKVYNLTSVDPVLGVDDLIFEAPAGTNGSVWYSGSGAPAGGTGINGDYYLRTSNGDVYTKAGGTWSVTGNIKGATGANGVDGTIGDYAENSGAHSGLNFAYYAGKVRANNLISTTAAGSVALTNTAANYIEVTPTNGVVSANVVGFTSDKTPLFKVVCAGGAIGAVTDDRCFFNSGGVGIAWFSTVVQLTTTSVTTGLAITAIPTP